MSLRPPVDIQTLEDIRQFNRWCAEQRSLSGSGQNHVVRAVLWVITPGSTPGTDINIIESSVSDRHYNKPTMTNASDLAKSGSSGNYALSSGGGVITVNLTENVVAVLSASLHIHDINSSSTTEMYTARAYADTLNIELRLIKRGTAAAVDWTSLMDAGDRCDMLVSFITEG